MSITVEWLAMEALRLAINSKSGWDRMTPIATLPESTWDRAVRVQCGESTWVRKLDNRHYLDGTEDVRLRLPEWFLELPNAESASWCLKRVVAEACATERG